MHLLLFMRPPRLQPPTPAPGMTNQRQKYFRACAIGAGVLTAVLLAACSAPPRAPTPPIETARAAGHNSAAAAPVAPLDAELLYQLLVAQLAARRDDPATRTRALDAFVRAAHLSDDPRVLAEAVALAAELRDHHRVIELAEKLIRVAPAKFRHRHELAAAYFATGRRESGLAAALEAARGQPLAPPMLQSLAALLARQQPPILTELRRQLAAAQETNDARGGENSQTHLLAAWVALHLDADDAFLAHVNTAMRRQPNWELAAQLKLDFLADTDRPDMAEFAHTFLRGAPRADEFRLQYGRWLLNDQQNKNALKQFQAILTRNPRAAEVWYAGGLAHMQRHDWDAALINLQTALELNSYDAQTRLTIADIHIHNKNFAAAADALRGITDARYSFDAQLRLAAVIAHRKGLAAALGHLQQQTPRDESQEIRRIIQQELLHRQFDQLAAAKETLNDGLRRMPNQPRLLYRRGLLNAELNLIAAAERDMHMLIELQPDNANAYNALGYTLADQGERLDEALQLITTALQLRPHDAAILDSMGWVHFRRGNYATAIDYLRRALDGQQNAEIAAHLGEALWAVGKRRAARKIWRRGQRWADDTGVLRDTLRRLWPRGAADAEARNAL